MSIVVTILHVLACFVLIVVVLLQTGKGADIGAVFGGSSQTIFGSSGAGNLLTRLTTWTAVVFMLTSLFLTWSSTHHLTSSIADTIPDEPPPLAAPLDGDAASVTDGTTTVTPQDDGATADAAAPAAGEAPAADAAAPVEAAPAGDATAPAADGAAPADGAAEVPAAEPAAPVEAEPAAPAADADAAPANGDTSSAPAGAAAPAAEPAPAQP